MSAMACAVFNDLHLEGKLCDAIISVDGTEFNAHKNILCSCSHYFRSVLGTGGDGDKQYFPACLTLPSCISSAYTSTKTLIQRFPVVLVPPCSQNQSLTWYPAAALEAVSDEPLDAVQGWSVASLAHLPSGGRFSFPTHRYALVFLLKQGGHLPGCTLSTAGGCDSCLKQPASKASTSKPHGLPARPLPGPNWCRGKEAQG